MLNLLKKYWPILIIAIFSLTPLLWFKNDLIIAGGDESILLNPGSMIKSTFYAWNPIFNGGNPVGDYQGNGAHLFPFILFWTAFDKLGLSLVVIEKLWFVLTWFFSGLGIYYLCQVLFKEKKESNLAGIFSSTLYLFNIYIMQYILMYTVRLPIMVLPWILAFTIKGLREYKLKYAALIAIASLFGASGWVNPPSASVMIIIPVLYIFFHILYSKEAKKTFIFIFWTLVFSILINIFWLYPFMVNLFLSVSEIKKSGTIFFFETTSVYDVFRFLGSWSFKEKSMILSYFPLHTLYYNNWLFIILSYFIPIISLSGFLFLKFIRNNKVLIFFLFLAVLGIFLVKGPQEPLAFLNKLLYQYIPGFWMFREPYAKFMPIVILAFSVLYGASLMYLITKFKGALLKTILTISGVLIAILTALPLPMGETIWHYYDGPAKPYFVKIPDYWFKTADWLKQNNPYATILTLPKNGTNSTSYDWESGFTLKGSVATVFLVNPYFYYQHVPIYQNEKTIRMIYDHIISRDQSEMASKLGFFGIKYLLTQRDIDERYNVLSNEELTNSLKVNNILENKKGLEKILTFDKLDLWEINNEKVIPKILLGNSPACIKDNDDIEIKISNVMDFMQAHKNNFIISSDNLFCPDDSQMIYNFSPQSKEVKFENNNIVIELNIANQTNYSLTFNANRKLENVDLSLDDSTIEKGKIEETSLNQKIFYKINLGELNPGKHNLKMNNAYENVLIEDNSFENIKEIREEKTRSGWEIIDASKDDKTDYRFTAKSENDSTSGKQSIKITAEEHTASLRKNVNLETNSDYVLSFYYKNYDNKLPSFNVEFVDEKGKSLATVSREIDNSPDWKKVDFNFKAQANLAYLHFYSRGQNGVQSVGIDEVNLKKILFNPYSPVIGKQQNSLLQKVNFTRINPTKYVVDINSKQPFYLNFLESFNNNWVVKDANTNQIISSPLKHYLLNGFANSWEIEKTGNYQLIIEYKTQKLLYLLYLISIFSMILMIIQGLKR